MTVPQVVQIGREVILTAILLAAPAVLVSLAVGLFISILQTITSIQEQTLSFAPRILAVGLILIATLPWMLQLLIKFTYRMFWVATQ